MLSSGSWPQIASSSERGVVDGLGERPDLVEARRERDQPVARDPPVGGLHPDDPAQRGGLADRAAGVRAERERREPGGDRGGGTTARTAGDPARVARVAGRAERRVLGRRAHRELVEVRLADRDPAGVEHPLHDRRGVRRLPALEDARRAGRGDPAGAEVVLQRDRDSGERARVLTARDRRVDRVGGGQRGVGHHEVERVQLGLARRDGREVLLDDRPRGTVAAADRGRDLACGHGASPRIRGTRKRRSSAAAPARGPRRGRGSGGPRRAAAR